MWVWIRVPLEAVERAISLLKEAAMRGHLGAGKSDNKKFSERLREKADADDRHAEDLKQAIREQNGKGESPPGEEKKP
jgi:hypothetical protein